MVEVKSIRVTIIAISLLTLNIISMFITIPKLSTLNKAYGALCVLTSIVTGLSFPYLAKRPGRSPSR